MSNKVQTKQQQQKTVEARKTFDSMHHKVLLKHNYTTQLSHKI